MSVHRIPNIRARSKYIPYGYLYYHHRNTFVTIKSKEYSVSRLSLKDMGSGSITLKARERKYVSYYIFQQE